MLFLCLLLLLTLCLLMILLDMACRKSDSELYSCTVIMPVFSYYHAVVTDYRERLVEVAIQVLVVTLDIDNMETHAGAAEAEVREGSLIVNMTRTQ